MLHAAAAVLLLALSAIALAAGDPKAMNIPRFLAHQEKLRDDLSTARFSHLDNESKRRLLSAQDVLFGLLGGKQTVEELSDDERLKVFDAQNEIAAVLSDAELDRPICTNAPRLGSRMHNIDCWSKRERDAERSNRHLELLRNQPCGDDPKCKVM